MKSTQTYKGYKLITTKLKKGYETHIYHNSVKSIDSVFSNLKCDSLLIAKLHVDDKG